jgi:AAA ATPase domain
VAEPSGAGTLGNALVHRRLERFVGRQAERELFESALEGGGQAFSVLFVHGPGGVGKSSLLGLFAELARQRDRPVVAIDGRAVAATPHGFIDAVGGELEVSPDGRPITALDATDVVVVVDSYEFLEPLDDWFRDSFLPRLPGSAVVVVAGRRPPKVSWRADPAWRDLLRVVSLRNLTPDESRQFLVVSGCPRARIDDVAAMAYGHPLALSLLADVVVRGGDPGVDPLEPDVVATLVRRLVDDVPSGLHRRALEACALARVTTESLLRDVLDLADAVDVFAWLGGLSLVDARSDGLVPHDLARDVLDVDLRWRDRESYDAVFRRVRAHVHGRLHALRGVAQQRAIYDEKFVFRNLPSVLSPVDWTSWGDAYPEPAGADDRAAILEMISVFEGHEAAEIAAEWWARQPEGFFVVRRSGTVEGVLVLVSYADRPSFDPGAVAAWSYAQRTAAPRPGEVVTQTRFVVDGDRYQAPSPTLNATPVLTMQRYLTMPALSWDFLTLFEPDALDDYFAIADLPRVRDGDFVVAGRRYGLFAHDFRRVPVDEWLHVVTERALAQDIGAAPAACPEPLVLSQPEFTAAVRQALRELDRLDLLAANPLCRTRLVADGSAESLGLLLRDAVIALRGHPRDENRFRALDRTYLRPAATQEYAAEALGLPFSTYRRHLTEGVQRVVADLWQRELYGSPTAGMRQSEQKPVW